MDREKKCFAFIWPVVVVFMISLKTSVSLEYYFLSLWLHTVNFPPNGPPKTGTYSHSYIMHCVNRASQCWNFTGWLWSYRKWMTQWHIQGQHSSTGFVSLRFSLMSTLLLTPPISPWLYVWHSNTHTHIHTHRKKWIKRTRAMMSLCVWTQDMVTPIIPSSASQD